MFSHAVHVLKRISCVALVCLGSLLCEQSNAAPVMYTIGPDNSGAGRVLTTLAPTGSPTALFALGDGTSAYNGLSYRSIDGRFYAIGNDSSGQSSLLSFNSSGAASAISLGTLGTGFFGMTYRAFDDSFYAAMTSPLGDSSLFRITPTGSTSEIGALGVGFLGGLAFGSNENFFYGISGDAFGVQRAVNQIDIATGASTLLFELSDGSLNFNGGLMYDEDAGNFAVIASDVNGDSTLRSFDLTGPSSLSLLGDIGPGYVNTSLLQAPAGTSTSVPEPATWALVLIALASSRIASRTTIRVGRCSAELRNPAFPACGTA